MFMFKGFKASLNFSQNNATEQEEKETAESISPFGVYRAKGDEFLEHSNGNVAPEKIISIRRPAVKSMPDLRTNQTNTTAKLNRVKTSEITNDVRPDISYKENRIQTDLKPNKSSILSGSTPTPIQDPKKNISTPDISSNNLDHVNSRNRPNNRSQEILTPRQIKKRNADMKIQAAKQKDLEKKQQIEQKKRDKIAANEIKKQEKINKQREKQIIKQSKLQEKQKSKTKKAPTPKLPPEPNIPMPPPETPSILKSDNVRPANPLAQNTVPSSSRGYSTNTLESSISKSSGPPPYSEAVKTEIVQNTQDNTGNTSFAKKEDSGSWDIISQHRQELNKAIRARQEKPKQMIMDLNYNFNETQKQVDNSEA